MALFEGRPIKCAISPYTTLNVIKGIKCAIIFEDPFGNFHTKV